MERTQAWPGSKVFLRRPAAHIGPNLTQQHQSRVLVKVLSQVLDEGEKNYHYLLSMQPRHRTALRALGPEFRRFPIVPYESRASLLCPQSYSAPPKRT